MKLWLKISIANIAVLLAVVAICGALLLFETQENILALTTEQTQSEQRKLAASFSEMARYFLDADSEPIVRNSAIDYCFRRFADESSVLIGENGVIYSMVSVEPEKLLIADTYEQRELLTRAGSRHVLIVGSGLNLFGEDYSVYIVKDVTDVFELINTMILRFIIVFGIGVIAGTMLIIFLIRKGWGTLQIETHIEQLEETNKRQQLFIGGLTHEFKTPMTSMILHSDTLLSADLSTDSAKNSLVHIHEQCRWLERLTQKLLKLITLGEAIELKSENVRELFDDVAQSVCASLEIDCKIETLSIDYDLMKSLLINLIDNAYKASEQTVTLKAYDNILQVSDCGKGVPQDEIAKITDPFYMVDRSRNKKSGGVGLGLALVKAIADAHKAELIIESEVGTGTTVKITLTKK
jgi:signal transduction histidine kinase